MTRRVIFTKHRLYWIIPILGVFLGWLPARFSPLWAALLSSVALAAWVTLTRPRWALLIFLILYPFGEVISKITKYAPVGFLFDVYLLFFSIWLGLRGASERRAGDRSLTITFGFLLFLGILQVFNPGVSVSAGLEGTRVLLVPMLAYFIGVYYSRDKDFVQALAISAMVSMAFVTIYGLVQFFFGLRPFEIDWLEHNNSAFYVGQIRLFSMLESPFSLAIFLAVGMILTIVFLGHKRKWFWTAGLVLMTGGAFVLLLTYVRGAWVGFVAGAIFALLFRLRQGIPVIIMMVGVGGFILPSTFSIVLERLSSIRAFPQDQSFLVRLEMWGEFIRVIAKYPLGLGMGATGGVSKAYESTIKWGYIAIDNEYLSIAIQMGFIGLIVFLLMQYRIAQICLRGLRSPGDSYTQATFLATISIMIIFFIANMSNSFLEFSPANIYYWIMVGICSGLVRDGKVGQRINPVDRQQPSELITTRN